MKKLIFVTILCTFVWLGLVGCNDDCPTCPGNKPSEEKDYHFLYSFVGDFSHSAVLTYSTRTGQVVDSAYYGRYPFWDVRFSKDGRYAYYTSSDVGFATTWVTDYATGDTVSILQGISGAWLSVSHDDQYLLLSSSSKVRLFRIPSLELAYESADSGNWDWGDVHPTQNIAVVPSSSIDSLLVIEFQTSEIHASKIPLRSPLMNQSVTMIAARFTPDGQKLILTSGASPTIPGLIQIRDATEFELLGEFRSNVAGIPFVHPDAERVFFVAPWRDLGLYPSSVWELNLRTLLLRQILDGRDYRGSYPYIFGLDPSAMDITPDGENAFLISGGAGMEHGPILKLNLGTYQIEDALYPPAGVSRVIRMYPKEVKN